MEGLIDFNMYIPKKYGESKVDKCPFCGKQGILENKQGVSVCQQHRSAVLNDMKCACGETLDLMHGKFGAFFKCDNCGTMNMRKVLEMNEVKDVSGMKGIDTLREKEKIISDAINKKMKENSEYIPVFQKTKDPKVIEIRSDDPMYFD